MAFPQVSFSTLSKKGGGVGKGALKWEIELLKTLVFQTERTGTSSFGGVPGKKVKQKIRRTPVVNKDGGTQKNIKSKRLTQISWSKKKPPTL